MARALRADLPFRTIAVVVSGGGAFGSYEVGVLKTLEAIGLKPRIVAGASAGALNAVAWVAAGFRVGPLELVWRTLEPASIGMRWATLAWRAAGAFLAGLGLFEATVTWIGSGELGVKALFWHDAIGRAGVPSSILDLVAWLAVAAFGVLVVRASRDAEVWLARLQNARVNHRLRQITGAILVVWILLHILTWIVGMPWPHRFSATLLAAALFVWIANRPGPAGDRLRRGLANLVPELKGRGLWSDRARRRILELLVKAGDSSRLAAGETKLILSALALDTGRLAHFVNWPGDGAFREQIEAALGEVIAVRGPEEVLQAAIASSAIPVLFEPARVQGREFVDAVALSTHPLQASLFAGADAALVIVVSPSGAPPHAPRPRNLMELWARYLDLANWHDLQREMQGLPASWMAVGAGPKRLCVVEPDEALPGGVLAYSPKNAAALIERGEQDAWRALERAGWLTAA